MLELILCILLLMWLLGLLAFSIGPIIHVLLLVAVIVLVVRLARGRDV